MIPRRATWLVIALTACSNKRPLPPALEPPRLPDVTSVDSELPDVLPEAPPQPKKRWRVVIVSEDGMRPDALDPIRTPIHVAVAKAGMVAPRAHTVRPSETLCSHASMLSGFAVADHKMTFDGFYPQRGQIQLPTIFAIAREHGLSTAMFVGKQKLWHIAPTGSVDHYEKPGFFCRAVAKRAVTYFESALPDLMFVHFADPDNAGHSSGWMSPAYMTAVQESDRCLGTIVDALERSGVADSTLLIVTADHGGSGRSHSGRGKELDTRIPWIVRGPEIRPGSLLDVDVGTADTAATALAALQLPVRPDMVGVSWWPPPSASLQPQ